MVPPQPRHPVSRRRAPCLRAPVALLTALVHRELVPRKPSCRSSNSRIAVSRPCYRRRHSCNDHSAPTTLTAADRAADLAGSSILCIAIGRGINMAKRLSHLRSSCLGANYQVALWMTPRTATAGRFALLSIFVAFASHGVAAQENGITQDLTHPFEKSRSGIAFEFIGSNDSVYCMFVNHEVITCWRLTDIVDAVSQYRCPNEMLLGEPCAESQRQRDLSEQSQDYSPFVDSDVFWRPPGRPPVRPNPTPWCCPYSERALCAPGRPACKANSILRSGE